MPETFGSSKIWSYHDQNIITDYHFDASKGSSQTRVILQLTNKYMPLPRARLFRVSITWGMTRCWWWEVPSTDAIFSKVRSQPVGGIILQVKQYTTPSAFTSQNQCHVRSLLILSSQSVHDKLTSIRVISPFNPGLANLQSSRVSNPSFYILLSACHNWRHHQHSPKPNHRRN